MHAEGLEVPKNLPEAIRLYEAAAKAGEFFAQVGLARIHSQGLGVPADSGSALQWYSAAAVQADRIADCEELREAKA
jgi:TPR repeat protein